MTYRNVRQARTADRLEARRKVQRGTHELVLVVQGDRSTREVASLASKIVRWWEDLRRGRLPVYGALLRFIDVSIALGTRRETLMVIPAVIACYINDRCDDRDGPSARLKLVA